MLCRSLEKHNYLGIKCICAFQTSKLPRLCYVTVCCETQCLSVGLDFPKKIQLATIIFSNFNLFFSALPVLVSNLHDRLCLENMERPPLGMPPPPPSGGGRPRSRASVQFEDRPCSPSTCRVSDCWSPTSDLDPCGRPLGGLEKVIEYR